MTKQTAFVPADLPGVVANTVHVQTPRPTTDDITVQILQNAAGSVGVGGIAALGAWQLTGADWQATAIAAAVTGFTVFCFALAIRNFADEGKLLARMVRNEIAMRALRQQLDAEWSEQLDAAEGALEDALDEIATLEALANTMRKERDVALAEAQQLRAQLNPSYRSVTSLYDNVRRDAKTLVKLAHTNGSWIGRDKANLQWGKERWGEAQKLLVDAGVIQINGKQVRILLSDMNAAYTAIDRRTATIAPPDDAQDD
jgi:hypothetical protein